MKKGLKIILASVLLLVCAIGLVACGNTEELDALKAENAELKEQVQTLTEQLNYVPPVSTKYSVLKADGSVLFDKTIDGLKTEDINDLDVDVDELIVSYLEEEGYETSNAFIFKVESGDYTKEVITRTYIPIKNGEDFFNKVNASIEANNNLYYMTQDVDISSKVALKNFIGQKITFLADGRSDQLVHTYLNLDGRGHKLSYEYTCGNDQLALFYCVKGDFKNLVFEANINGANNKIGAFAYRADYCNFTNCYFRLNSSTTERDRQNMLIRGARWASFENCVFELNDMVTTAHDKGLIIGGNEYCQPTIKNCAVVTTNNNFVFESSAGDPTGIEITNLYKYASLTDLVSGANGTLLGHVRTYGTDNPTVNKDYDSSVATTEKAYTEWADVWEITASAIKLCGQTVVDFAK